MLTIQAKIKIKGAINIVVTVVIKMAATNGRDRSPTRMTITMIQPQTIKVIQIPMIVSSKSPPNSAKKEQKIHNYWDHQKEK